MLSGAIFDMDGTLLNTEKIYQKYWLAVAAEFGVPGQPGLGPAISGSTGEISVQIFHRFYPQLDYQAYMEKVVEHVEKDETDNPLEIKPGVTELLAYFKDKGVKLAVASSCPKYRIELNLTKAGLRPYFAELVGGDMIVNGKPAPDIFQLASAKLGLAPADCYGFEDSFNGVRASAAAGNFAIMVPDTAEPTDEIRAIAKAIYPSMTEVKTALEKSII